MTNIFNQKSLLLWKLFIGAICTVTVAILSLLSFPPLEIAEMKLYDANFHLRGVVKPPKDVVIAAIDDKSLERYGRWPWKRDRIASLVDTLSASEAAVIAFDIIFSEKEENDPQLAESVSRASNVILPSVFDFHELEGKPEDILSNEYAYQSIRNPERFRDFPPISASKVLLPVKILRENAMSVSPINIFPDSDGTVRWDSMAIAYGDRIYPSLPLVTAAAFLGVPPGKITLDATRGVDVGTDRIPTDRWGRTLINYYGPGETFPHVSIADILDGTVPKDKIANRIVLVGATAVGIYDLRVTPFSAAMPGVEKHASTIASIIDKRFMTKASSLVNLLILIVSSALFTILLIRFKFAGSAVSTALFLLGLIGVSSLLFSRYGIYINLAAPIANFLGIFIGITSINYAIEEKRARKIRSMFSSYVTQTVVNELINNPEMAKLGGERREVTIMFSDVKGFTTFAEKHTPEEVVSILNEYLGAMTDIILKWDGTLDKFIGDAIVVFWGAPITSDSHAEKAVKCALEMSEAMGGLRRRWEMEGKPMLDAGIGINTGFVLVGNIGAEGKKMDYTIIGDQVNLCSRVESLTRRYDVPILLTGNTVQSLIGSGADKRMPDMVIEGRERVIVKGKNEPVAIYSIAKNPGPPSGLQVIECPEGEAVKLTEK
jgi:adenylate cyclase